MSRIQELIKEMCPNGVEYKKLSELVDYIQPTRYIVKDTNYNDAYKIPVLTAGQTFILGYTNEKDGIFYASRERPIIIFDDFTTSNHWINFDFKIKSSAIKILVPKTNNNFRYIYYCIKNIKYFPKEHSRQWIQIFSEFKIPVPPLPVQEEIVRILDKFGELEAELEARQSQYEFWRGKMLNTKYKEYISLGEIGKVCMCKRILKNETSNSGDIPFYKIGTFGKEPDAYIHKDLFLKYKSKFSYPKVGDVLISCSGTIGKTVIFDGQDSYYQDSNIVWIDNDETKVLNKFLYYFYQISPWKIEDGGTIKRLYTNNIVNTKIPLYPLEAQKKIVIILDKFDKLANDISEGLPAEIELRKKQYEYYRNKLLSFKELNNG